MKIIGDCPYLLQLVFDASLPFESDPRTDTVFCTDVDESLRDRGVSAREFLKEGYEEKGREACLRWVRLFAEKDPSGRSLHDLFEWDGVSALWFTPALLLFPELGVFLTLMVALRSLELLGEGEYASVRIVGSHSGLVTVFEKNGYPCEEVRPGLGSATRGSWLGRVGKIRTAFSQWFVQTTRLRWTYRENNARDQTDCLFYAVQFNEWELPGSGKHRYLGDTIEEILDTGVASSARPLVFGRPPVTADTRPWDEFLDYSLKNHAGVYPMVYASPRVAWQVFRWSQKRRRDMDEWLRRNVSLLRWGDWDLEPMVTCLLREALGEAARKILLYEVTKIALRKMSPRALILKDEVYPNGRTLCAAAQAAGVKTVAFQHGNLYPTHWCYVMDGEAEGLARPPLPDVFAVYGRKTVSLLSERNGFPRNILHVVGARRFRTLNQGKLAEEIQQIGATGKPIVLLAGQLHPDMTRIYDWMFQITGKQRDAHFVFKPHPRDRERVEAIRKKCEATSNASIFMGPLGDVLPAARLTISGHSTVLLESVWLKIGAVSVQISGEEPADWQLDAGLIKIARSFEELASMVTQATAGGLFTKEDEEKARVYLEEELGYSFVFSREAIAGLFG